jgi:hypothetical protein
MNNELKRTSFFWPIVLIGAGVILLLRNLGILQAFNFSALLRLWPLILVVIGLDMIFGHKSPWVGGLIGLITVAAAIAFLYYAPSMGINPSAEVKTEVVSTPLENTQRVEYNLDTSFAPVTISALSSSTDLVNATIIHHGQLEFDVIGDTVKTVNLSETITNDSWFSLDLGLSGQKWDIGLAPSVPTSINFNGSSGSINMDLTGIKVDSLRVYFGSGSSHITLPVSTTPYGVEIESGSGSMNLAIPVSTDVTLQLDTGSGSVNVPVPVGSGLMVEVLDDGSGSVNLPAMTLTQGDGAFEHDTWQTANFTNAANKITIQIVNRGSGSINISINN